MFAAHNKLDNLCLVVDSNGLQIDGPVRGGCGSRSDRREIPCFGFDVQVIDGHDFDAI